MFTPPNDAVRCTRKCSSLLSAAGLHLSSPSKPPLTTPDGLCISSVSDLHCQQVKAWKAAAGAGSGGKGCAEHGGAERGGDGKEGLIDGVEGRLFEALLARVRLRRGWYAVVCHLSKGFKSLRSARKSIAYSQTQLALVRGSASMQGRIGVYCPHWLPPLALGKHRDEEL